VSIGTSFTVIIRMWPTSEHRTSFSVYPQQEQC
jgi:hypothetical protein